MGEFNRIVSELTDSEPELDFVMIASMHEKYGDRMNEEFDEFKKKNPELFSKPKWVIAMFFPDGSLHVGELRKDAESPTLDSIRGSNYLIQHAELIIAYHVGVGEHKVLKSRFM